VSKRNNDKGRLQPFVPLLKETLDSPAWKAMSMGARVLYTALKGHYNRDFHNNGRIYLSQRDAAEAIGSHKDQVGRWFRELQHYGFIVMIHAGCLGVDGKGQAPRWRLTELSYMKDPPTRDFMRWKPGHFFTDEKFYPVPENQDGVSRKTRTVVSRKTRTVNGTSVPENQDKENGLGVPENQDKENGLGVPENQDKSSIPLVGPNGAGPEVGGQVQPPEPELTGLKVWTTPTLIELPWNDEWARRYCEVVEEPERSPPPAHAPIGHNAGPPLQPEAKITGLKVWTTPILTEIPYTDELRRLYAEAVPADNDLSIPEFLLRTVQ
jgi:hypothetical protein